MNKKINVYCWFGYVGLPLALETSDKFNVFAYDNNKRIISNLKNKI